MKPLIGVSVIALTTAGLFYFYSLFAVGKTTPEVRSLSSGPVPPHLAEQTSAQTPNSL